MAGAARPPPVANAPAPAADFKNVRRSMMLSPTCSGFTFNPDTGREVHSVPSLVRRAASMWPPSFACFAALRNSCAGEDVGHIVGEKEFLENASRHFFRR